jgi:hypothetical protein
MMEGREWDSKRLDVNTKETKSPWGSLVCLHLSNERLEYVLSFLAFKTVCSRRFLLVSIHFLFLFAENRCVRLEIDDDD